MFYSWLGMQGVVHGLSCVVGFTVRVGQLMRSCSGVCVCSRGRMAGCLTGHWWGYVHVHLRKANNWVLVGGRVIVGPRGVSSSP